MPAREINLIVIHCSASPNGVSLFESKAGAPGFKTPIQVIDGWHKARGFHRQEAWRKLLNQSLEAVGYHFVIYTSGVSATGRHVDEIGAHAVGYNSRSIGICMVGIGKYSPAQWDTLKVVVQSLQKSYPKARVVGHRDLSPDLNHDGKVTANEWLKTCPVFEVADWLKRGMVPAPENVLEVKA